jgi:hypothetical protein
MHLQSSPQSPTRSADVSVSTHTLEVLYDVRRDWRTTLYPASGLASVQPVRSGRSEGTQARTRIISSPEVVEARLERRLRRRASEARRDVFEWCVRRGAGQHVVLTYASPVWTHADAVEHARRFRTAMNSFSTPFITVAHVHESGAFHHHVGLVNTVSESTVRDCWLHGDIRTYERPSEVIAGYLSSRAEQMAYVAPRGCKLYSVTRGSQVEPVRFVGSSLPEAIQSAANLMGGPAVRWSWPSDDAEWSGPPTLVLRWDRSASHRLAGWA